jgi:hypothetical protein
MRNPILQIAVLALSPLLYFALAAQNVEINIGAVGEWKNYDHLPEKRSGDFDLSEMSLSVCPIMLLKDQQPEMVFRSYVDENRPGASMVTAAPKRDEQRVQWVLVGTRKSEKSSHVVLRAPEETSSADIDEVWRLLKHCETIQ